MKKVWVIFGVLGILALSFGAIVFSFVAQQQAAAKKLAEKGDRNFTKVEKGEIEVDVIETGSLEAVKTVEVKSRVGGRIAKLLVDEGDWVKKGDLIAVIDPQETELQVQQNKAQLKGAESNVRRQAIEIDQRRITLKNGIEKAKLRIAQLESELKAQPVLTKSSITQAETAVASAQKSHDLLVKVTQPNAKIVSQNAVEDAKNNLEKARLEEDRQKQLFELGYTAKRNWEQAELQSQLAATRVSQAQDSLSRIESEQKLERERSMEQVNQAKAQLASAKAGRYQDTSKAQQLQSAKADLRDAEAQLKDIDVLRESRRGSMASVEQLQSVLGDSMRQLGETEIRAPFDGLVSNRSVQVGELVSALSTFSTGTPIVTLEDRSAMLVKLTINEIDVARLEKNMEADIEVDAFPTQSFSGSVTKIAPSFASAQQGAAADAVVKYEVEVRLDRTDNRLKGGMSAKCTMRAISKQGILRVPLDFVGQDEKGRFLMKVVDGKDEKGEKKTERIDVVVGPSSGKFIEIIEGATEGMEIKKPDYKGPDRKGMMSMGSGDSDSESEE